MYIKIINKMQMKAMESTLQMEAGLFMERIGIDVLNK
jgi:hypothetical protein